MRRCRSARGSNPSEETKHGRDQRQPGTTHCLRRRRGPCRRGRALADGARARQAGDLQPLPVGWLDPQGPLHPPRPGALQGDISLGSDGGLLRRRTFRAGGGQGQQLHHGVERATRPCADPEGQCVPHGDGGGLRRPRREKLRDGAAALLRGGHARPRPPAVRRQPARPRAGWAHRLAAPGPARAGGADPLGRRRVAGASRGAHQPHLPPPWKAAGISPSSWSARRRSRCWLTSAVGPTTSRPVVCGPQRRCTGSRTRRRWGRRPRSTGSAAGPLRGVLAVAPFPPASRPR